MVNFDVDVSADGNTLYFVDSRFAKGGIVSADFGPVTADLVIAERRDATFERAANSAALLEHVNTEALEYAACISEGGLTLFFNRLGKEIPGLAAIYVATRSSTKEPFGKPLRLTAIEGFAEGAALSPDEKSLYYHTKDGDRFVLYKLSRQ